MLSDPFLQVQESGGVGAVTRRSEDVQCVGRWSPSPVQHDGNQIPLRGIHAHQHCGLVSSAAHTKRVRIGGVVTGQHLPTETLTSDGLHLAS